jgi:hypothetical protein
MSAKSTFQKSLYVLDAHDVKRGEELLRRALSEAESEKDQYTMGHVLCCLGELLHQLGRNDDAEALLNRFLGLHREDDVLDEEQTRVEQMLAAIKADRGF